MNQHKYRKINLLLLAAIIVINTYTIMLPFLPMIQDRVTPSKPVQPVAAIAKAEPDQSNRLIIPKMDLNTVLIEGPESDSKNLLDKGAWHLPFASTPDQGGNTVIAGHRFSYTGPRGIFYFLNKLEPGDEIGLKWNGKLHTYRVESSRTVPPTEVSVQEPTSDARLTLYTCTPLINPTNRLVVVARPAQEITP